MSGREDGYTLAETLAALFMIGLALGGMAEGVAVLGKLQTATGRSLSAARASHAVDSGLTRLLEGRGPFRGDGDGFTGVADRFGFDCGAGARCGAQVSEDRAGVHLALEDHGAPRTVTLAGLKDAHFVYVGSGGAATTWPSGRIGAESETLRSVTLVRDTPTGEVPVAAARLWAEQPADCAWDMISQACRGG